MKTRIKKTRITTVLFFALLAVLTTFISCSGDGLDPELEVKTIAAGFSTGNDAITVDHRGNIYVSEYGRFVNTGGNGTRVFKITPDGDVSDFITGLSGPLGNAMDFEGNFYVVNANNTVNGQILKIAPDGTRSVLATLDGWPAGLALDHENNIYVSNFLTPTVHKITQDGVVTVYGSDPRLAGGVGMDFDRKGNLIVGNYATSDILSIKPNGNVSLLANIPDIVVNGSGIGYITVVGNSIFATGIGVHKIFKVSMNGNIEEFAGTGNASVVDGPLKEASFNAPNGITADPYNRAIYISEYKGDNAIRKITLY